jgi:alpha-1,3-rhamnosyl/mannosyltransferase
MHLGVDLRIADRQGMELSGLGRYALELAHGLAKVRPEWRLSLYTNRPDLLAPVLRPFALATRWTTAQAPGRAGWLLLGSALDTARDRPEMWLGPSFALPPWRRGPSVVTIHDLIVMTLPEHYRGRLNARYAEAIIRSAARRADRILCGSQSTRAELGTRLGVALDKVEVTPYGVSEIFFERKPVTKSEPPYLLYVGTFESRKGLEVAYQALRRLVSGGRRLRLVLAGQPGWGVGNLLETLERDGDIDIEIGPADSRLAELMRGAIALVYPSRQEGFGLPVAEAMAARCPVIASDLAPIREFAQDVPLYAPVGDAAAIAAHAGVLIDDTAQADRRRDDGARLAASLRWSSAAERTAEILEHAMGVATGRTPLASLSR